MFVSGKDDDFNSQILDSEHASTSLPHLPVTCPSPPRHRPATAPPPSIPDPLRHGSWPPSLVFVGCHSRPPARRGSLGRRTRHCTGIQKLQLLRLECDQLEHLLRGRAV